MSHRNPTSLIAALVIAALSLGFTDPVHDRSTKGVKLYSEGDYAGAVDAFDSALEEQPDSPLLYYDRAASLYQAGMFEESAASYAVAASDPALAAPALYGAGNALAKAGDLEKALEAYRQSLMLDPGDEDAKHNYERVQQMLEEQQQQQDQEQQDGESDENQEQEQQEQEQQDGQEEDTPPDSSGSNQEQQQEQGEQDEEQQQEPEDGEGQDGQQPEQQENMQPQPGQVPPSIDGMSQEDAERILEALAEEEEAERNAALEKRRARQKASGKDW